MTTGSLCQAMPGWDDGDLVGEQHSLDAIAQAALGEKVADVGLEPPFPW